MSIWTESPESTWASIITLYMTLNKYLSVRQEVSENDRGMSLHETQKFIWAAIKSNYCYIIYSKKRFLNLFQALHDHIHEIVYKSISIKNMCDKRANVREKVPADCNDEINKNLYWIVKLMLFYAKCIARIKSLIMLFSELWLHEVLKQT